jgi:hypothetical protein
MPRVGVNELARIRGVSHPAVLRAETARRISPRGPDGKFDLERAMREWDGTTDQSKPRNSVSGDPRRSRDAGEPELPIGALPPDPGGASDEQVEMNKRIQQSRVIREHYAALREKMLYEREAGRLVDADELRPALFEVLTTATNAMRTASSRIVPSLGLKGTEAVKMKKLLDDEMEKTIGAMRQGFTRLQNPKPEPLRRRGRPRKAGRAR